MKTTLLTLNITFRGALHLGLEFETGQDIEEFILLYINDEAGHGEVDEWEEVTDLSEITYELFYNSDIEEFENLCDLEVLNEIAECSDLEDFEWSVISAGIEAGIDIDNIAEAFAGGFDSAEEFAEDMAEQCGMIDREAKWPQTCIDWEQAAKELMYDYSEANGYYFRNF